jgi:large repetitive protein
MRKIRILLLLALVGAIAGIAVPNAKALGYEDEPCPPQPQLKVCHPDAQVGKSYSLQIVGKGGCTPDSVVYSVISGSLPPGLSVSSSNALVSGIPTQAGVYQFWLQVADIPQWQGGAFWCQDDKQSQWQFQITVVGGLSIVQRQSTLTPAQVNKPYSLQLSASGGGNLTWSVAAGALPAGLSLNASTGLVSGTPTAAGDSSFQIKVTDGTRSDVQTYSLSVVEPLVIAKPTAAGAEVGQSFKLELKATGGKAPYTWSAEGLPSGLTLDAASGVISGTPADVSTATVKVTVTDALGEATEMDVSLRVEAKLALKRTALPNAKVGAAYSTMLSRVGGVAPFQWAITSLKPLPAGIKLNAKTGRLYGAARRAGTYRFRVQVTDSFGLHSSLSYVLKVTRGAARR